MSPNEDRQQLVEALKSGLASCGYSEHDAGQVGGTGVLSVLATAGSTRRKLVAVADVPAAVTDLAGAVAFVADLRKGLTRRYVSIPWPGRLGTFTVLLVGQDLWDALRGQEGSLIDAGGMKANFLLGTVLVNTETCQLRGDVLWEHLGSEEHFPAIQRALEGWASPRRQTPRMQWRSDRTIQVA